MVIRDFQKKLSFVENSETMNKINPYKEQKKNKISLGELIMDIAVNAQNRRMLDYVREDIRIGLEQYACGEYER